MTIGQYQISIMALYDWSGVSVGKIKDFNEFEIIMPSLGSFLSRLEGVCYEVEPGVHFILGCALQAQRQGELGAKAKQQ